MNVINGLFGDYLFVSFAILFLTALVLLLSHYIEEKYTPHWRVGICKTFICCLIIPVALILRAIKNILDSVGIQVYKIVGSEAVHGTPAVIENAAQGETVIKTLDNVLPEVFTSQTGWMQAVSLIWIIGTFVLIFSYVVHYVIYRLLLKRRGTNYTRRLQKEIPINLANRKKVNILVDPKCKTPYVIGFLKPIIVLPCREYDEKELEILLIHEIAHIKRHDTLLIFCAYLAIAMHWFNPASYIIYRNLRKDLELCCDYEALQGKDKKYRYEYCSAILKEISVSEQKNYVLGTGFSDSKSTLKRRFDLVLRGDLKMKKVYKNILIALSVSLIMVCALAGATLNEDAYADAGEVNINQLVDSDEYRALIQRAIVDKDAEIAERVAKASEESNTVYYLNEQEVKNHTDENGNVDESWLESTLAGFRDKGSQTEVEFDEKSKEIKQNIYSKNSYAPHVLANGDIGTYYDSDEKSWSLKAGDKVKISIYSDKEYYHSSGKINYGYVKDDGERVDVKSNYVLQGEDSIDITVPEDGEYYFCILCAAGEPIIIEYMSIDIE